MTPSRNTRSSTLRSVPSSPGRSFFQSIDIPPYVSSCLSCLRDGQVGWVGVSAEHCDRSMDYDSIAVGVVKAMFYKIAAAFDFSGNSDWVCCVLLTLFVS